MYLGAHVRVLAVVNHKLESGASVVVWAAQATQTNGSVEGHLVIRFCADATHCAQDSHQVLKTLDFLREATLNNV